VALLLILVVPCVLLGVATYRPSWYQPPSIDYNLLEEDKRTQLRLENEISAAVNRDDSVTIELDQDQVERWVAARHELWPGEVPSLGPFRQPQVDLLDENRFRVGALIEQAGVEAVVSATFQFEVTPETITVTWDHIHTGALRTPRTLIAKVARKASSRLGGRLSAAELEQAITDRKAALPNDFIWPNGKRRVRIAEMTIEGGELRVKLEPF
jgi:hypothetical protein